MSEIKEFNDQQEKPLSRMELFVIGLIEQSIEADRNEDGLSDKEERIAKGRRLIEIIRSHRYDDAALDNLIFFWDISRPSGNAAQEKKNEYRTNLQKRLEEFGI